MFALTSWGVIKNALMLIGASTAPEDARVLVNDKWPAIARWFVETPQWSGPVALFFALGLAAWLVWPQSAAKSPTADFDPHAPTPTQDQVPKAAEPAIQERVAPKIAATTGGLLGAPLASLPTLDSVSQPPPHFWWRDLPVVDEGADKNSAKKKIVQLYRRRNERRVPPNKRKPPPVRLGADGGGARRVVGPCLFCKGAVTARDQ